MARASRATGPIWPCGYSRSWPATRSCATNLRVTRLPGKSTRFIAWYCAVACVTRPKIAAGSRHRRNSHQQSAIDANVNGAVGRLLDGTNAPIPIRQQPLLVDDMIAIDDQAVEVRDSERADE